MVANVTQPHQLTLKDTDIYSYYVNGQRSQIGALSGLMPACNVGLISIIIIPCEQQLLFELAIHSGGFW
jgi:hypothetical protein